MTDINSNWRLTIPIGSNITIDDKQQVYIFYGYNCDKSLASCFPVNSICAADNMISIPLNAILSVSSNLKLETEIENKLKIN